MPDKAKPNTQRKTGKSAADLTSLCKSEYTNIVAVQNTKTILKEFLVNGLLEDIADLMEIAP